MSVPREEITDFLRGVQKKHGLDVDLVLKVRTDSGKVRKRTGRLRGLRGDQSVGLYNEARGAETWYDLDRVLDAWKKGSRSEG